MNAMTIPATTHWNPFPEMKEIQNRLQSFLTRTGAGNGFSQMKRIDASFKDGVLTVHLPKSAEKKAKKSAVAIVVK
jgi:hypothetical protein